MPLTRWAVTGLAGSLAVLFFVEAVAAIPFTNLLSRASDPGSAATSNSSSANDQSVILQQLGSPKGIVAILLLVGGDVIHKAIAQLSGSKGIGGLSWAPVAFSFGWVTFSLQAAISAWGDGILMPKPEDDSYVINVDSGNIKHNESWILHRLVRDLEREHQEPGVTVFELRGTGRKEDTYSGCDTLTGLYGVTLAIQFALAAVAATVYRHWLIAVITGIGILLATVTTMLPQWKAEKFDARPNDTRSSYMLTRGNGHEQIFILHCHGAADVGLNLDDLATVRPEQFKTERTVSKIFLPILALGWIFLLILVGGMDGIDGPGSWLLLGIGAAGMLHNFLAAGLGRHPAKHGIQIKSKDQLRILKKTRDKEEEPFYNLLRKTENMFPGAGITLSRVFFDVSFPLDHQDAFWEAAKSTRENEDRVGNFTARMNQAFNLPGPGAEPVTHDQADDGFVTVERAAAAAADAAAVVADAAGIHAANQARAAATAARNAIAAANNAAAAAVLAVNNAVAAEREAKVAQAAGLPDAADKVANADALRVAATNEKTSAKDRGATAAILAAEATRAAAETTRAVAAAAAAAAAPPPHPPGPGGGDDHVAADNNLD